MVNSKHAFWIALVFAVVVFSVGLLFGFFFEGWMTDKTRQNADIGEINLLDEQVRFTVLSSFNVSCEDLKKGLFDFADEIYSDAVMLEEFDLSDKFGRGVKILHQRYDLLRMMLWEESIQYQKKCGNDFHTLVYLFVYSDEKDDPELRAMQNVYSRVLLDVKGKYPDKVLLIPIAGNLELESIDAAKSAFGVKQLPSVIVDNDKRFVLSGLIKVDDLEKIIFNSNNT